MRQINNEVELLAIQEQIDAIVDKQNITQDDKDYLKVLGFEENLNLPKHC